MNNIVTILAPSFSNRIFLFLAGNKDNHKVLDGFEIRQDQTSDCGVSCP